MLQIWVFPGILPEGGSGVERSVMGKYSFVSSGDCPILHTVEAWH